MPPKPLPGAGSRELNAELEEAEDLSLSPDAAASPAVSDSINPSDKVSPPVFTNAPQDSDPRTPRRGRNVERRRLSLDPQKKTHAAALIEPSKKTYAAELIEPSKKTYAAALMEPSKKTYTAPLIKNAKTTARPSPSGGAEDDLREKGLEDPRKIGSESDTLKRSSPSSLRSRMLSGTRLSQPGSPASQGGAAVEPRPKVNLYGGARPREEVLKERGQDPSKIDSEFWNKSKPKVNWSNDRQDTEGKKLLTEEINHQKAPAEELNNEPAEETQLDLSMHQLDDQVRSDERSSDDIRPGSGAGRSFRCSIL